MNKNENIRKIAERSEYYRIRMKRRSRAHYIAKRHALAINKAIGTSVILLSSIVGSTIFSTLENNPETLWKIITGTTSLTAAALSSVQTFFKFSETASLHHNAATRYAGIFRTLDGFQLSLENSKNFQETSKKFVAILDKIDEIENEAPYLSDRIYDKSKEEQINDNEGV